MSTLPKLGAEEGGEQVEALADLFASFRVFDVDVAAARLPSTERRAERLANNASNLAAFLAYLADGHPDRFAALQQDARAFIPGLERLDFVTVGGAGEGTVLHLVERALPGSTMLQEASNGSIRAFGAARPALRSGASSVDLHRGDRPRTASAHSRPTGRTAAGGFAAYPVPDRDPLPAAGQPSHPGRADRL
nr:hypothetical protein [Micromonospora sp. DSM 115978]